MCGIAGIVHADPGFPVSRELLGRMTDAMAHRGPDAESVHLWRGAGFGHRRLSIIDLATGDQPMFNEDRTKAVILNGEIYNFPELRSELEGRGHRFTTRADTEVIVHAYEEFGVGCVARLRGMFAFALWDEPERRLLLARDRVGKKPLYYTHAGERLCFASELKALLQDASLKRGVSAESLDDYFSFGAVQAPATIFQGVIQLPPGHYLVWERGAPRIAEYWDVPRGEVVRRSEVETVEAFAEVFADAVRVRLVSDVPLGAFLSGGVDSSAVVDMMARLSNWPVVTTSVGFSERAFSELGHARAVATAVGAEHHEVLVEPRAVDVLPRLVWHLDEPFADSSALPTYYVSRAAREQVTVALSGDGGDEVFAGYQRRYGFHRWEARLRRWLPTSVRTGVMAPLGAVYPKADWLPRPLRARYFLQNLGTTPERAYFSDLSLFRDDEKARLLSADFRSELADHDPFTAFARHFERVRGLDSLSQLLYVDLKTWLANDILVKVDRMSMANSLEVRAPLLDHKVIEFAATVPPDLKYRGRTSKYLLKRHLEGRVPRSVIHRPKQGFEIPLASWLRGELREMAADLLLSPRSLARGYVRPEGVRRLWQDHQTRVRDHSARIWALIVLELWHRSFVDEAPGQGAPRS
ncbi:MAG: asparagine synthase (glutamine-hydrolyzing) [Candidatus Rokubacteria bacterium]|nr:asparagine synthase (glutamine-hydrolyzing) [Candidatus Rokubacteria bacterium]